MSGTGGFGLPPGKGFAKPTPAKPTQGDSPPCYRFGIYGVEERCEYDMEFESGNGNGKDANKTSSSSPALSAASGTAQGGVKTLSGSESMMYTQKPLNAPLGTMPVAPTLTDFIFPDKIGQPEDSILDDESLAEIRAIARRSNCRIAASRASLAAPPVPTTSVQSVDQLIPDSLQVLSKLDSSQSLTSQSTASSTCSSLGSTGSQGTAQVVSGPTRTVPTAQEREIANLEEKEKQIEKELEEMKAKTLSAKFQGI